MLYNYYANACVKSAQSQIIVYSYLKIIWLLKVAKSWKIKCYTPNDYIMNLISTGYIFALMGISFFPIFMPFF